MENSQTPPVERIHLQRREDGGLVLHLDGQSTNLNPPRRALPLSDPGNFIVLSDSDGKELFMLDGVMELDVESRVVLLEALEQEYRLERITRILEIEKAHMSGQTRWRVELAPQPVLSTQSNQAENEKIGGLNGHAKGIDLIGDGTQGGVVDAGSGREREFCVNDQEDVQTARYPHIFIIDTERNRYEILNCDALDPASRRVAEIFF